MHPNLPSSHHLLILAMQENPIAKKGDRTSFFILFSPPNPYYLFSDITVTLTFLRSVDQPSATDPPDWSTVSSKSGSKATSLRSPLPSWSTISDQFAEIEAIDTHAPLLLRSSKHSLIQLKSGERVMLMLVDRQQIALSGSTRDPYGTQRQ